MAITIIKGKDDKKQEGIKMTHQAATSYACVAYRIMEYEGGEQSEEYLDILMGILYDFYTEKEIEKIYMQDIKIDSYQAVINDTEIKKIINE